MPAPWWKSPRTQANRHLKVQQIALDIVPVTPVGTVLGKPATRALSFQSSKLVPEYVKIARVN